MTTISTIIPVYNEQENIPYIEKELFPILDKLQIRYEVIFVDDGSTDNTVYRIKELHQRFPQIHLLQHEQNRGMGAAIRTAIPHCTGEITITLDSDLTFHPRLLKPLLERYQRGDVDVVIGSPALHGYDSSIPWYRRMLSKAVNMLYMIALGRRIHSVSPIFRAYNTKKLQSLTLTSKKYQINSEILAKLLLHGARVVEIPAQLTVRKYGESKLNNTREIINHARLLFNIMLWRIRHAIDSIRNKT